MNRDPYSILGVSQLATDDEIKKAYRELAKKYHPDNFTDEGMRKLAEEQMKEINEAYEYIQKQNSSAYSGEYQSSGDVYAQIRVMINQHRFDEADTMLDSVPNGIQNAEWNFLKGCIMTQKGWFLEAERFFDTACRLAPENEEYRSAYESLKQNTESYARGYRQMGDSGRHCNITCCDLICMECVCEMCCEGCCEAAGGGC